MTEHYEPAIKITLNDIFARVVSVEERVGELSSTLTPHVTITKSKQDEYETRLENHSTRLATLDTRLTVLETRQTPRTPWYSAVGGIVGIVAGVSSAVTLIILLSQLSAITN